MLIIFSMFISIPTSVTNFLEIFTNSQASERTYVYIRNMQAYFSTHVSIIVSLIGFVSSINLMSILREQQHANFIPSHFYIYWRRFEYLECVVVRCQLIPINVVQVLDYTCLCKYFPLVLAIKALSPGVRGTCTAIIPGVYSVSFHINVSYANSPNRR